MAIKHNAGGIANEWGKEQDQALKELQAQNRESEQKFENEFKQYASSLGKVASKGRQQIQQSVKKNQETIEISPDVTITVNKKNIQIDKAGIQNVKNTVSEALKEVAKQELEVTLPKDFSVTNKGKSKYASRLAEQIKAAYQTNKTDSTDGSNQRLVAYYSAAKEKERLIANTKKFNLEKQFEFSKDEFTEIQNIYDELITKNETLKKVAELAAEAMRKQVELEMTSQNQSSVLSGNTSITDEERELEVQEKRLQLQKEHIRLVKESQELKDSYVKLESEQGYDFRSQETSQANVKLLEKLIELRQNENSLKEAGVEFDSHVKEIGGLKENELDEELRLAQAVLQDWMDVNKQIESVKDNQKDLAYYMEEVVRLRLNVREENWFDDDDKEDMVGGLQLAEKQLQENIEFYQKYGSVVSEVTSEINQSEVLSGADDVQPVIEGQEKIQNELKETENQARVTVEAIKEAYERRENSRDSWTKASINRTLNEDGNSGGTRQVLSDLKRSHESYDLSIKDQWDWETQYQWAVKFIAFYEEYASRADGTAKSLAKHTELYNQLKPLAEGYRADLQAVLDYKPEVNQTPLSSPDNSPTDPSKAVEAVNETADKIDAANEEIEASNEEVEKSEEELEQATVESRSKSSAAAKKDADEKIAQNERVIASNKEVAQSEQSSHVDVSVNTSENPLNTQSSTASINNESSAADNVSRSMDKAAESKNKFAKANKNVEDAAKASKNAMEAESNAANEVKNAVDNGVTKALNHLISTEATYQKLTSKKELTSLTPTEASNLAQLTAVRERDNEVIRQANNLTDEQIKLQEKYNQKVKDIEAGSAAYQGALVNDKLSSYDTFYNRIDANKRNLTQVVEYKNKLDELKNTIKDLKAYNGEDGLLKITSDEDIAKIAKTISSIETLEQEIRLMHNNVQYQGADTAEALDKMAKISQTLEKNTKMPKALREMFEALRQDYQIAIDTGASQKRLEELNTEFARLNANLQASGKTGNSFFNLVSKKITGMSAQFFATYVSLQDLVRYMQQAYQYVADIDKQMIELEKVSDMSASRLEQSFEHAAIAAKDLGATISDVLSATSDWSKLGYDADAAEELAEVAILYKNVGDGIDISTANESLISTLQGFQLDASEAESVVDKFNEVKLCLPT